MDDRATSIQRNSAGLVCASVGISILTLTFIGVGWVQFVDSLPPEGMVLLLALGGGPATIALVLGLRLGLQAKTKLSASTSDPICSSGIRVAGIGLGLLLLGAAFFGGDCIRREMQKSRWVAEAQVVVEEVLTAGSRIPTPLKERLGSFQSLTGVSHDGPSWNIEGQFYLIADRTASFANGTIPVRIYVTEGSKTNKGNVNIVVQTLEIQQLYLQDAPIPKVPMDGLKIMVSHPAIGAM